MGTRTGNPTWVDSTDSADAAANPSRKITAAKLNAIEAAIDTSVPTARTVAGKPLSSNVAIAAGDLTATGTKNTTTFLRGDNTWAVPPSGGGGSEPLAQVGTITLPPSPALGQSITVVADDTTSLPGGITWDSGVAPSMATGRRVLGLIWTGEDWVGTYSPVIPVTFATLSEAILSMSPAGYWKLDETSGTTATDASGNGRHGTYTGSTYTLNARDGAPSFSGGGHVTIPDHDSFTVGGPGITIFGIGYVTEDSSTNSLYAMKGAEGEGYEWGMGVGWAALGRPSQASWWTPGGSDWQAEYVPGAHPKDEWVALAASIMPPRERIPIYRNSGAPAVSTQMSSLSDDTPLSGTGGTGPLRLAKGAFEGAFTGSLRHVAIFPRKLSQAEVGTLMNAAQTEGLIP